MILTECETRLIEAINFYREARDLPHLTHNPLLTEIARKRVYKFSHKVNGMWIWEAAKMAGYPGFCTDNVAQGYESPEDAVGDDFSGWGKIEGSVGHDQQMKGFFKINGEFVDYNWTQLGVGCYSNPRQYLAVFGNLNQLQPENKYLVSEGMLPILIRGN